MVFLYDGSVFLRYNEHPEGSSYLALFCNRGSGGFAFRDCTELTNKN